MGNAYNIFIELWELDKKLHIFLIELSMGRLKFVRASKFWQLLAQLAGRDFGQSFTPEMLPHMSTLKWQSNKI